MGKTFGFATGERDLHDYTSPIQGAGGIIPYNGYLWPTESWWPSHTREMQWLTPAFTFGVVELMDGRWATEGFISDIELGYDLEGRKGGKRVIVFNSRKEAIRTAAARMLQSARESERLTPSQYSTLHNWTITQVAQATLGIVGRLINLEDKPEPITRPEDGLEIWDNARLIEHVNNVTR